MLRLATPRLVLGPHRWENLEKLNNWFNDDELAYYDDDKPKNKAPETLEETRGVLERILKNPDDAKIIHYAIYKRVDGTFIGYGQIAYIDLFNRRCRLGITIGDKKEWGKGYAKEALSAVIHHCFEELNLNRIGAEVYEYNSRSIKLFEGLGFRREGVIRQSVFKKGEFRDEYVYGLLKEEWGVRPKGD